MSLERVVEIVASLPDAVVEQVAQHHKLRVKRKTFGWYLVDHHGDGREALHCKAGPGENQALVAADPDRFFLPPHLAKDGFVGLWLDTEYIGWDEVRELLTEAWRIQAPKRLVARFDQR